MGTAEEVPRLRKAKYKSFKSVGQYFPADKDLAMADTISKLPLAEQAEVLKDVDPEVLNYDFRFWGRPSQLAAIDADQWLICLLAGRGYGKTRALSEWVHNKAMTYPGCRIALVGRVTSDVRDVIVLGESGIMNVAPPEERPRYVTTMRRVIWPNGSEAMTFSADIPDQLRGPQFHYAACDELGSWRVKATGTGLTNAWDNVRIATRLGKNPQIFVATTPRRVPMILDVMSLADEEPERVLLIRGSTYANRHLAGSYLDVVTGLYAGTHMGAQELEGELIGSIEGALLDSDVIDDSRTLSGYPDPLSLPLRAVGVDPSVSERPFDECGIVVACSTGERELYKRQAWVYEDASVMGSPQTWARRVVEMSHKYQAVVVAESNQGGDMVRMVIHNEDSTVPVVLVRATAGKALRAEPVVLAYEQSRVHHTDYFGDLESQLTSWVPNETLRSPDRLDGLVHALAALLVRTPSGWAGTVSLRAVGARTTIPGVVRGTVVDGGSVLAPTNAPPKRESPWSARPKILRFGRR
jgi:phage terminase large subunit-like protein